MTTKKATGQPKVQVLEPGYVVALVLKESVAPLRCYVGQVQAVDEHGVRLTLVDWLIGEFLQWDFFAPWESITAAMVATPQHDVQHFGEEAGVFQVQCNHMAEGKLAMEQAVQEYRRHLRT